MLKIFFWGKINLILTALLLASPKLFCQVSNDTLRLTINQAIAIALEKSWDIQIANKDIEKAEEQISEAYANAFPRLEFSGRYIRNIKSPVLFIPPNNPFNPTDQTMTIELGSKNSYDLGFSVSQVIYNQKVNTAIQIANEYSEYSKFGEKSTRQQIINSVKKAFYNVLLMQELLVVSKQNYNVAKANLENVAALYKQGVVSEYDFLRSEVQVANVQPYVIQTENGLELSKNYLKNLLALDLNQPIKLIGEFSFEELSSESVEQLSTEAVNNNPLINQLKVQASLLEKNITIQQSDYFPTLAFFGAYQFQAQDNTFKFKEYNWAKTFYVGLQLSYTLFDGFSRSARIEQAVIDKQKVDLSRMKLEEGLKIQILQAKMKMEEAKKRIGAQEKSLLQAEKALKIAQSRYKNGVGTQLELIDTQAALTTAKTNYAQAIYDYLISKADWEYAVSSETF
ncbi:MAG: TolC family protein [Ignavibacteriaceae bacterium]|nr:TolC family protein [Ignavibacteriaceae bacterium]